jgi:hypothetical protein
MIFEETQTFSAWLSGFVHTMQQHRKTIAADFPTSHFSRMQSICFQPALIFITCFLFFIFSALLVYFYTIVVLGVICDIYESFYNIS